jgi:Ca2+/Na+ antiporter
MLIKKINVLSAGMVVGLIYGLIGFIFGLIISVSAIFVDIATIEHALMPRMPVLPAFTLLAVLLWPVLYGITGFIGAVIFAAFYNIVARWTGGLRIKTNIKK